MTPLCWPCPLAEGGAADEYALVFDRGRDKRLLIVPALFDEANRLRRFCVEVMRRLEGSGIDCFLPDLPGTNESLQPLHAQTDATWRSAMEAAALHFTATHVLGVRGGCLYTPGSLPGWHYAPVKGASLLRQMLRARVLAAREAGRGESQEGLLEAGAKEGLELSGHALGPAFLSAFQKAEPVAGDGILPVGQSALGGSGLWLRAEPGEASDQADALATLIATGLAA